jgi:hypothetical protein
MPNTALRLLHVALAALLTLSVGCSVADGDKGTDGRSTLVRLSSAPAEPPCPSGGTRIETGLDDDRDGVLDDAEVDATQLVCSGPPGDPGAPGTGAPPTLVATSHVDAAPGCPGGGVRIDVGVDDSRDGVLDPGEIDDTDWACDGPAGPTHATVLGATPEIPGQHCAHGGTRIDAGADLDDDGELDAGEIESTVYSCFPDVVRPRVLSFSPPPGTPIAADSTLCVTFSEPVDPTTLDVASVALTPPAGPGVPFSLSWDAATRTACALPSAPMTLGTSWSLVAGGGPSPILDTTGNLLLEPATATWPVTFPAGVNLTVSIDAVTPTGPSLAVAWTVRNVGTSAAGPFRLGLFADPAPAPTVGAAPDVAASIPGLAAHSATSGTTTLTAPVGTMLFAYADVDGEVAESIETDNLARGAAPGALPALTGPVLASPASLEEGELLSLTIPVSGTVRSALVVLIDDLAGGGGPTAGVPLGSLSGNAAGEGAITGTFLAPVGAVGDWTLAVTVADASGSVRRGYALDSVLSTLHLATWPQDAHAEATESGIPWTGVEVRPTTKPNLVVTITGTSPGAAPNTVDVAFTVKNVGVSAAAPSTLGLFVDPAAPPGVGSAPQVPVPVPTLGVGEGFAASATVTAAVPSTIVAFADVAGVLDEGVEGDNADAWRLPTSEEGFFSLFGALNDWYVACTGYDMDLANQSWPDFSAAMEAGRLGFDPYLADGCRRTWAALGCLDYLKGSIDPVFACAYAVLPPQLSPGAPCDSDLECVDGWCATSGPVCPGTCAARLGAGEPCPGSDACQAGFVCAAGTCQSPTTVALGDPCDGWAALCPDGAACAWDEGAGQSFCRAVGAAGSPCSNAAECGAGLACDWAFTHTCLPFAARGEPCADATCNEFADYCEPITGRCAPFPGLGQPCAAAGRCAEGSFCDATLPTPSCAPPPGPGGDCSQTWEVVWPACSGDAWCDAAGGHVCRAGGGVGASCTANEQCGSGAYCSSPWSSGSCQPLPGPDEPCGDDSYCRADLTCYGGICVPSLCY